MSLPRRWLKLLLVFFLAATFLLLPVLVAADIDSDGDGVGDSETPTSNPKSREILVTAQVKPRIAPPFPVLIAPANESKLTSGVVTFEWYHVTGHIAPLEQYQLHLNGQILFHSIRFASSAQTDDYTVTFDGTRYKLTLKPDKWLPDGTYTWKIRVLDVNNLGSDSSTWSFTIDSTAPPLLLTKVEEKTVAISATDPTTIPTTPLEVLHPRPKIEGKTEASSEVQLVVQYPDGEMRRYKTQADLEGRFHFVLESMPRDEVVYLRLTAIDPFLNTRVLDRVPLQYVPRRLVISLPLPLPEPLTLTLFYRLPRLPVFLEPTPSPVPEATPAPQQPEPTRLVEVPVVNTLWWWVAAWLGLGGYILTLFWLTGNSLRAFFPFLFSLLQSWLLGVGRQRHELRVWQSQKLLPFGALVLMWAEGKRLKRQQIVADPAGHWSLPRHLNRLWSIESGSSRLGASVLESGISQTGLGDKRVLELTGESFLVVNPGSPVHTSSDSFVIETRPAFRLRVWLRLLVTSASSPLWLFLPRLCLLLSLLSLLWLLVATRSLWVVGALLVVLTVWVRDLQWQLPQALKGYGYGEKTAV